MNRQRLLLNRQIKSKRALILRRREKPLQPDADGQLIPRRRTLLLHRIVTVTNNAAMPFFRKRGISIPEARADWALRDRVA